MLFSFQMCSGRKYLETLKKTAPISISILELVLSPIDSQVEIDVRGHP